MQAYYADEDYDQYNQDDQNDDEQQSESNTDREEEQREVTGSSFRVPYESAENRDRYGRRHVGEESKLYRNIVKRYRPEDSREMSGSRSKGGSPNKQMPGQGNHLYHPEANQVQREMYRSVGGKMDISKQNQWERLTKPKKESLEERDRMKREKEAMEIKKNCTFQPSINKSYQSTSAKYVSEKNQSVSDRLYAEGMEKIKSRDVVRRKSEDEREACTFQPNVAESVSYLKGEKLAQRPIHERLGEIMKQKQEFMQKIRVNSEIGNKDMVFKPTVNEYSQILANSKQQIKDVTDRLMKDAADKVHKKMRHNDDLESKLTTLCTFQPNVQPMGRSNDEFLAGNDLYANEKDIVTRQYIMADIQRENLQRKAAEVIAKEGCTFAPQINKISQFLIEADPHRANENVYQKVDRLYKKDAQKKDIFQEQMQKAHYDQYTFKPEINKISKDIGKRTNLDDLAYNREAKEHLRVLREKSIDNMLSGCSFKPDINRKKQYEDVEPLYKADERIMDNVKLVTKKKEIKYDQLRKMDEYNEMKECTFKPQIKGEIKEEELKPKLGSAVAGVDKFMQMRERHKKQQEEKKKREQEVFGIDKKYSAAKHEGFTTPQPFNLSKGAKTSIRNMKVNQDLKERATKNYTFKPSTNEAKNRELINKYMSYGSRNEWEN